MMLLQTTKKGQVMKSSTIRRSTLSKESMEVIEALAKENESNGTIGEYVRPEDIEVPVANKENEYNKTQEIDLLWQNFKSTQFNTNSPTAYVLMGFVGGVVATLLVMFCIGWFSNGKQVPLVNSNVKQEEQVDTEYSQNEEVQDSTAEEQVKTPVKNEESAVQGAEETKPEQKAQETKIDTSKMKKYVVKSGDTGESIIKHFYGTYTPERAERVMKANNLTNLDRINIDQELYIPVEK